MAVMNRIRLLSKAVIRLVRRVAALKRWCTSGANGAAIKQQMVESHRRGRCLK